MTIKKAECMKCNKKNFIKNGTEKMLNSMQNNEIGIVLYLQHS